MGSTSRGIFVWGRAPHSVALHKTGVALSANCERCGRPGEVFYYKGVEAILCGDCLPHLEEIVDAKLQRKKANEGSSFD